MFCCLKCGVPAFLVRGLCQTCDPELHRNWTYAGEAVHQMTASFEAETGKPALLHWSEYEDWFDAQNTFAKQQALAVIARAMGVPASLLEPDKMIGERP